ncbi:TLDc domain-containing protein [Entamoeba marina]
MIEYLNSFVDKNDNNSIITKEMNNANTMIKCLNQLVDKILEKETTIFNKKEHKFGQQKQQQKKQKKQQIVEQKNQHRKQIFEQKNKKQKTKQIFEQQKQQSKRKFKQQKQQRKQEFEEKINDIKNMKFNYHNTEEGKQLQHIEEIKFENDNELKQLNNSIQSLIEWSGKQNYNVIFDSKIDGNGKGVLENKVMNKKNLYFISFDNHNNVFGGYVDTIINKTGWIKDINAFVFSLIRKGKVKNKKYVLKQNFEEQYAFYLSPRTYEFCSYCFGKYGYMPIYVKNKGIVSSWFNSYSYEYNGEQYPLVDDHHRTTFKMERILVLEMV